MKHYIAMAGLHGYLPQTCEVHDELAAAAYALAQIHELSMNREMRLRRERYVELDLKRDGNEYAEITECECATPWVHSDGITQAEWERDHPTTGE